MVLSTLAHTLQPVIQQTKRKEKNNNNQKQKTNKQIRKQTKNNCNSEHVKVERSVKLIRLNKKKDETNILRV